MGSEPLFLRPLKANIARWDLPPQVAADLLEEVGRQLDHLPLSEESRVRTFEIIIPDPSGDFQYGFYAWVAARLYRGDVVITDCDCQYVTIWPST